VLMTNAEIPNLPEGSRVKWCIDKILRATGVPDQIHLRWDKTNRAEMVEFLGASDHTAMYAEPMHTYLADIIHHQLQADRSPVSYA